MSFVLPSCTAGPVVRPLDKQASRWSSSLWGSWDRGPSRGLRWDRTAEHWGPLRFSQYFLYSVPQPLAAAPLRRTSRSNRLSEFKCNQRNMFATRLSFLFMLTSMEPTAKERKETQEELLTVLCQQGAG